MKNKLKLYFFTLMICLIYISPIYSTDQFNFDVTEIEINEKGNKFIGKKRGVITTDNNIKIEADEFIYDKSLNTLKLKGNISIDDIDQDLKILSEEAIYYKNQEIFVSNKASRFIKSDENIKIKANEFVYEKLSNKLKLIDNVIIEDLNKNAKIFSSKVIYYKDKEIFISESNSKFVNDELIIASNIMKYNKILDTLNANGNVSIEDKIKDYKIFSEEIDYLRNTNHILTKGKTKAIIESKYNFNSSDVELKRSEDILSSNEKTKITDNNKKLYEIDEFEYNINSEVLKAKNLFIVSDSSVPIGKSDNLKFTDGFFNLKNDSFVASETEINLKKDSFDNEKNDPRLKGISSNSKNQITTVNKGVFTSCKKRDDKCPPWSIKAKKITHDKNKKQLIYDHAVLNVYDKPVMYFPKFFHPDPSVERQTGFLKPQLNNSEILGSSLYLPYFYVISESKDYTFKPTIFENDMYMFQNEYRSEQKNSSLITDFSLTTGYKSSLSNNKNTISHLFTKYDLDLDLSNFESSKINFFLEKVSNDTYLKVFDTNLMETEIKPSNPNKLNTGMKLLLDHEKFNFDMGLNIYENLQEEKSSDRYEYVLPYYNFSRLIDIDRFGLLDFSSNGSNNLIETNNLETNITNNINYKIIDNISEKYGFKNNLNIYFKNLNTVAKNNNKYKSSLQSELMSITEINTSLPLGKTNENFEHLIEPKISFRWNPSDMKNYKSSKRLINADNVFSINRLGLSDSFEAGKSLTLGINYKKTALENINKYFETKISTVYRDKKENFIPESSTINNKNSNIFGSITYNQSENFSLDYNFTVDNDFSTFNKNSITSEFSYNSFKTSVKFLEENNIVGNTNSLENYFEYKIDENNFLSFNTRRNRTINLTEYYDLLYEYKNDCLTAGFKYKKTYYEDRDLKPKEDLLLTITFYPLTTYEQEIDQDLYRN
tara:strand:+ start:984 stop:3809 length:2826 start_codon:yes stop_codon:yes gene_type:complete